MGKRQYIPGEFSTVIYREQHLHSTNIRLGHCWKANVLECKSVLSFGKVPDIVCTKYWVSLDVNICSSITLYLPSVGPHINKYNETAYVSGLYCIYSCIIVLQTNS